MHFLNAVLPLAADSPIVELAYLPVEQIPDIPAFKRTIADVKCRDSKGRAVIVEMQMNWTDSFKQRLLFGTSQAFVKQLEKGEQYHLLQPVYGLGLIAENFDDAHPDWYHHYRLVKKGDVVGVIGLGGLGHMGVKFAHALGAHVVMITTSKNKAADAKALGAHEVLISTDSKQMAEFAGRFDFLLNTIPVMHDINPYLPLLKIDSTMVIVGAIGVLEGMDTGGLIFGRKRVSGSLIGGIKETQEMLDFCGKHNIVYDVEMIDIKDINHAYSRMIKSDVKYRFVIDIASLK